jgi:1,4-alpha-glucan branching enzyme
MSLKKQYLKTKPVCKVSFDLPTEATDGAKKVHLVGEFNNWKKTTLPMKKRKSGEFVVTVDLTPGQEYQFRYLIDGKKWENDWDADRYIQNTYGDCDNSLVVV